MRKRLFPGKPAIRKERYDGMEYEMLISIISEALNMDPDDTTPDASFVNDLGADSLDLFQLILKIEEEFGVEISAEEADRVTTVADLHGLLTGQGR